MEGNIAGSLFEKEQYLREYSYLKNKGKHPLDLSHGDTPTLAPLTETGSGQVREKQEAYLAEIIAKVNADAEKGSKVSWGPFWVPQLQQAVGKATGSKEIENHGKVDEIKGQARVTVAEVKRG